MITVTATGRWIRALIGSASTAVATASVLAVALVAGPLGPSSGHEIGDLAVDPVAPSTITPLAELTPDEPAAPPTITYLTEPTRDDRATIEWAVGRYLDVGLRLPDLEVDFPVHCGGKAGNYFVGQGRIELCVTSRMLVLHELAHAWDDANDVDRALFMGRRGLDHWYEQDGRSKHESGGEQLAHLLSWGLMDIDVRHPTKMFDGQPIEDRPRRLMHLEDADLAELIALYTELTGAPPTVPWWSPTSQEPAGPS